MPALHMLLRGRIPDFEGVTARDCPILRQITHRRFASTEPSKLVGPMDNAFNRERLAVKQHAAQSADLWRKLCI
ncbi:MAG: hypothetical protein Q9217_003977 [Psora testacea]